MDQATKSPSTQEPEDITPKHVMSFLLMAWLLLHILFTCLRIFILAYYKVYECRGVQIGMNHCPRVLPAYLIDFRIL